MSHGGGEIVHHENHHSRLIVFSIFIAILAFLIVTSFYDGSSLTGNFINGERPNSTTKFYAELTSPNLDLEGNFEKLEIRGGSDSFFYVGDQKFRLSSTRNYIIIENYTGEMSFNSQDIKSLNGKALKVTVNGIVMEPNEKDSLKVSFEKELRYTFLNIESEVLVKKIFYSSSGIIKINDGKNIFNLEDENIGIENFIGSLKVENNKFKMNGSIEGMEIQGKNKISVSQ